jgi:hypothetical protein
LFFDQVESETITVQLDDLCIEGSLADRHTRFDLLYKHSSGAGMLIGIKEGKALHREASNEEAPEIIDRFRTQYFLFNEYPEQNPIEIDSLASPYGGNLGNLVANNKEARATLASFFSTSRFRPLVERSENKILLAYEEDGTLVTFPYESASETLRRMAFYTLAIETNRDQVVLFDEPEAHSFPPYTKTLAERIALDEKGNQFFLTTHSPYMLDSLLSKTPASELNVVLCQMENFETKAYPMNQDQIDQIKEWSMDAFFNFDRLLPELK